MNVPVCWGIPAEVRERVLRRVYGIVEDPKTSSGEVIRAFRALVEATKVDLRVFELVSGVQTGGQQQAQIDWNRLVEVQDPVEARIKLLESDADSRSAAAG